MNIKAVIIDDEMPAREALKMYVSEYCEDVEISGMAGNADEGFELISRVQPNLVFLDIQMPHDNDGFRLLDRLPSIDFRIIFITAHSQYAQRAFRYYAVDYLLKPVSIRELTEAVEKVKREIMLKTGNENLLALKSRDHLKEGDFDVLIIRDTAGFRMISVKEIVMCEAEGTYTRFFLSDDTREMASKNLKHYQETLEKPPFIRVHHSFLINLHHVKRYNHADRTIFLSGNLKAPLGESYRDAFLDMFR